MPNDGVKIVEADLPTCNTNIGMKRENQVPAKSAPGHADVTNDADKSAAGYKNPKNLPPDFFKLVKKGFIIFKMSQLVRILIIMFEIPIWRRGDDEMYRFIFQER